MNFALSDKISRHLSTIKSQSYKMPAEYSQCESKGLSNNNSIDLCCLKTSESSELLLLVDEYLFNKRQKLCSSQAQTIIELIDLTIDSIEMGRCGIVDNNQHEKVQHLGDFEPVIGFGSISIESYQSMLLYRLLSNNTQKDNYQDQAMEALYSRLESHLIKAKNTRFNNWLDVKNYSYLVESLLKTTTIRNELPSGPFDTRYFGEF